MVIAGFGLNGQNVARVLRSVRLPHLVVDLDPDAVALGHGQGSPVLVGDIGNALIQREAGVPRARVLVLALSDPTATRHACRLARSLSSELFIIVRTRYVDEIDQLYAAGANQVIPEEFETSIEIFTAVMRELHVPDERRPGADHAAAPGALQPAARPPAAGRHPRAAADHPARAHDRHVPAAAGIAGGGPHPGRGRASAPRARRGWWRWCAAGGR